MVEAMAYRRRFLPEKVLIYEHYSAGGTHPQKDPESIALEGLNMAFAFFSHFLRSGRATPCLLLREDLLDAVPRSRRSSILPVSPGNAEKMLLEECRGGSAVVLIAPETGGLSAQLAEKVKAAGGFLLGSDPATIALASDKGSLLRRLSVAGIPCVPWKVVSCAAEAFEAADGAGYPVVIKPPRGTGGGGSAFLRSVGDLEKLLSLPETAKAWPLVLQPYVEGFPASLSILAGIGKTHRLISVNRQDIVSEPVRGAEPVTGFRYVGGAVGLSEKHDPRIKKTGLRTLEQIAGRIRVILGGLLGYAGVDLILSEAGPLVLEVNPRMTTPLAILARYVRWNMADVLVEACLSGEIPRDLPVPVMFFTEEDLAWPVP
jgi:predicted ATP-grasp superfamily ATP-dependent carboligase